MRLNDFPEGLHPSSIEVARDRARRFPCGVVDKNLEDDLGLLSDDLKNARAPSRARRAE